MDKKNQHRNIKRRTKTAIYMIKKNKDWNMYR